ncbi:MAG: phosphate/phosphite/phosphonate ABC transporter substrate-binding protein [Cetobacterium sp.]|uniref:phosphate/phosphite/phosphonate ABC transporter substrate-binding protein n=1 Tax=Cetobacterium sp. TaxID=2071632 RepID=UPI003F307652
MKKRFLAVLLGSVLFLGTKVETQAFFGSKGDKLILGFLPTEGGAEFEGFRDGLAAEIEKATGKKVEVRTTDSYEALIDAMIAGEMHLAFSGGNQYIMAKDDEKGKDNIEVVFTYGPNGDKEQAGYQGWITTKKGSKLHQEIKSAGIGDDLTPEGKDEMERIKFLKGKRFSFVSPTSSSGFKVPRAILNTTFGIEGTKDITNKDDFANPQRVKFMDITFSPTGDHQGNINAIFNESVDAGAFCEGYFVNGVDAKGIEDFYVLARRVVPNGPVWVNVEAIGSDNLNKIKVHFKNLTYEKASEKGKQLWTSKGTLLKDKTESFLLVDDGFYEILRQM